MQLHQLDSTPSLALPARDSLIFVADSISGAHFLIDTGAACSILPLSWAKQESILHDQLPLLYALRKGTVDVLGLTTTSVNLGFLRQLEHQFFVSDLQHGILGADFCRSIN